MSFFVKGKQVNGIKRAKYSNVKAKKKKLPDRPTFKNEEITSSEDETEEKKQSLQQASSSEDENETAQEKKLRLAKVYLQEIEKEEKARLEKDDVDQEIISKRLHQDYLKEAGKLRLTVADKYKSVDSDNIKILKCKDHRNSITCICISENDKFVFAGNKDGVVVKYSLTEFKKTGVIPYLKVPQGSEIKGHSSQILSIAISSDAKYLAVGDNSSDIQIWEPETLKHIKTFKGHKNSILGLAFKKDSHTLYSCSKDKTIKVWSLDEMAYVETLFGHQDAVVSVDTLYRDRIVTSGGRDLRIWKITEETQLIYNGHNGNIDNVKLINEEHFLSSGDDGQICVWSVMRKKPLQCIEKAHGTTESNSQPYWITAVTALMNTDLIASGSNDGFVRLWKLDNNFKNSSLLLKIPVQGFVNMLSFSSDGKNLIIAVSREYRLGRWIVEKSAKNCIMIVPFVIE